MGQTQLSKLKLTADAIFADHVVQTPPFRKSSSGRFAPPRAGEGERGARGGVSPRRTGPLDILLRQRPDHPQKGHVRVGAGALVERERLLKHLEGLVKSTAEDDGDADDDADTNRP